MPESTPESVRFHPFAGLSVRGDLDCGVLSPDDPATDDGLDPALIGAFVTRWSAATGSERANYQLFLTELCTLLGLPRPDPAREDTQDNAYCFERRVCFQHGDGPRVRALSTSTAAPATSWSANRPAWNWIPVAGSRPCCAPTARRCNMSAPCP